MLGSLERDLQFRVNGEVYRFGSKKTLRRFMAEPQLWCGMLRDPVTGRRFMPSTQSPEAYYIGGPYFFEADSTKDRFVADPHRYEVLREL